MKKALLAVSCTALALPAAPAAAFDFGPSAPASPYVFALDDDDDWDDDDDRDWRRGRGYDDRRYYRSGNGIRYWRGDDGRYYCKRSNGTTGLIVGAAGGALLGRAIDTRGERATGTILGAAAGALIGREIDRGRVRCR